ncbi:hypothetical protein AGMMS50293_19920 [Spirochaetia bacterium]|nr:hypothetical protein AGMMS50293_19920 [Spirochaetia bacterium]
MKDGLTGGFFLLPDGRRVDYGSSESIEETLPDLQVDMNAVKTTGMLFLLLEALRAAALAF